jgi:hypothetical protein
MLIELLVCGALLGVVLTTAIPTLRWILHQRRFIQQREAAVLEVDNLLERLTSVGWNDLTTDRAAQFQLAPTVAAQLPGSRLEIKVDTDADDPRAKRVHVELTWETTRGQPAPPVRLTTWVYSRRGMEGARE